MEIINLKFAVVIPSYKVQNHILKVIQLIGNEISRIYIVDDCCPNATGEYVKKNCNDPRVVIVRHQENQGVGGAVMTGYKVAINEGMDIIIKIDGDNQMDPTLIPNFINPILCGEADYTKGNRFFNLETITNMPWTRLFGNAILSFMTKVSSGYWDLFDPTNGFTAIHRDVAKLLPFDKISRRYFFETDMLFRLNTLKAVVVDIPMEAKYDDEVSNLRISKIIGEFIFKHTRNFIKRIFYNYYLRDLSIASIELPVGLLLFSFGTCFGYSEWNNSYNTGKVASSGTVMLAAMPIILGVQLILSFFNYDTSNVPKKALHTKYSKKNRG
ncbi:MAG: glycosyltransferase family 2 protein [Deltaproteobacteria bacterium]|nr:glycosyltransferase family 2 protein [Deltaproteobacteria bacterium]